MGGGGSLSDLGHMCFVESLKTIALGFLSNTPPSQPQKQNLLWPSD